MLPNKEAPFILCIETSGGQCSVAIGKGSQVLSQAFECEKNKAADRLPILIASALEQAGIDIKQLQAVAVSGGPGSYTGLRIGVATAKGIAYALGIPLIHVETFLAMKRQFLKEVGKEYDLYIPMIDARRMDAFYAVVDNDDNLVRDVQCETISEEIFHELESKYSRIAVIGQGLERFEEVLKHSKIDFYSDFVLEAHAMVALADEKFSLSKVENLAYFEPLYYKAVHLSKKNA
ncbi:MAG: tRNA (adenosine(37)-N6)-threonylcarbamoyltransferase complex dimerization subunit type 1 TsaB [Chitinophagales bacterium]|nr:tRNA (adenosine(37)-N6)-threonylcarbamoyltransferase complex dimerization subunit type 1 TsaB [Chitinophagales bacterium]